jgi:hypothetical protein
MAMNRSRRTTVNPTLEILEDRFCLTVSSAAGSFQDAAFPEAVTPTEGTDREPAVIHDLQVDKSLGSRSVTEDDGHPEQVDSSAPPSSIPLPTPAPRPLPTGHSPDQSSTNSSTGHAPDQSSTNTSTARLPTSTTVTVIEVFVIVPAPADSITVASPAVGSTVTVSSTVAEREASAAPALVSTEPAEDNVPPPAQPNVARAVGPLPGNTGEDPAPAVVSQTVQRSGDPGATTALAAPPSGRALLREVPGLVGGPANSLPGIVPLANRNVAAATASGHVMVSPTPLALQSSFTPESTFPTTGSAAQPLVTLSPYFADLVTQLFADGPNPLEAGLQNLLEALDQIRLPMASPEGTVWFETLSAAVVTLAGLGGASLLLQRRRQRQRAAHPELIEWPRCEPLPWEEP